MLDALTRPQPPALLRWIFKDCLWRVATDDKILHLTFDDGPQPGITDYVLDLLKEHNARATFFCIGSHITANPLLYKRIINEGHTAGNHTQHHLNGWSTSSPVYYNDIKACTATMHKHGALPREALFRPPYGKLTFGQYLHIRRSYRIVMWDVICYDFLPAVSGEEVLRYVLRYSRNGSIVVMHDSHKAAEKVRYALPRLLRHFTDKGYKFAALCS
ncbi:MAG: polysaccharide deacetylase family protein [Chitinophagales bacterium]|nr:polysaccharide deacetylase family protein [Chitinophagales bacterium]MDW8419758.1 polysaccharide deacetylase family protein [Chitinophagales bacterium]